MSRGRRPQNGKTTSKKKLIELGLEINGMENSACALAFKKGEVIEI